MADHSTPLDDPTHEHQLRAEMTAACAVRYTANDLRAQPTLATGQADDLKLEHRGLRYWLSRCGVEDGEPCEDKVSVEAFDGNRWVTILAYDGQTGLDVE